MARTATKLTPAHGTSNRYVHHGCRCKRCKTAIADYVRESRRQRQKAKAFSTFTHGTRSSYNNGCRCDSCTTANREYACAWKRNKVA